tara:strand:+ start:9732 stop:10097 length:366 start_codon:yes stop_codon:yes gene_type:complete
MHYEKEWPPRFRGNGKTYVFDIDGTICTDTYGEYEKAEPLPHRIEKVNELYDNDHTIILFTARGMGRTEGNVLEAQRRFFDLTLKQVEQWGIKYHRLILGKPAADFYIDDKGIKDGDFFGD